MRAQESYFIANGKGFSDIMHREISLRGLTAAVNNMVNSFPIENFSLGPLIYNIEVIGKLERTS